MRISRHPNSRIATSAIGALSGYFDRACECPLSGVKRTFAWIDSTYMKLWVGRVRRSRSLTARQFVLTDQRAGCWPVVVGDLFVVRPVSIMPEKVTHPA